jgi:hypothetical protein
VPRLPASGQIDKKIADHPDGRGKLVAAIRRLVREADPEILKAFKWRGVPTWSHNGLVYVANIFKDTVKVVFARGAKLADPEGIFNSELAEAPGGASRSQKKTRSTNLHSRG